jgi:DNA-binding NtrC family response regulator
MSEANAAAAQQPILVIEDDLAVAEFLRSALERHGYGVVLSASAADGLQLLSSGEFRGVVSDVRMPGELSGVDVKEWLLRHRPGLASRFVFITGDTASAETVSLVAKAKTPCIEKPFRLQQFLAMVEETIGKP